MKRGAVDISSFTHSEDAYLHDTCPDQTGAEAYRYDHIYVGQHTVKARYNAHVSFVCVTVYVLLCISGLGGCWWCLMRTVVQRGGMRAVSSVSLAWGEDGMPPPTGGKERVIKQVGRGGTRIRVTL